MEKYKDIDKETVEKFFDAFPNEYMSLSKEEQKISGRIYFLLSKGKPVSIDDIGDSIGIEKDHVNSIIDKWAGVHYNDEGDIIAYRGLAIGKSAHTFKLDETTLYTWCAWDTLFLPQIIGKTARVESTDPVTKETISLTVSHSSGISDIEPTGSVITFLIPETEEVTTDIISCFCCYVHFFTSRKSADEWISQSDKKDDLMVISLEDAYSIALQRNELLLGEILETA